MTATTSVSMSTIGTAVLRLDSWLESMRAAEGYSGPVVHWWSNCLQYTGVGLDWRYEGIIIGYLNLYDRTGDVQWLARAIRAGDDLVRGQLANGNYRNSNFEMNPYTAGTPHEAACDLALLHLAGVLRDESDTRWRSYLETAARNVQEFYVARLWNHTGRFFAEPSTESGFVPNKAATLVEALIKLAQLTGESAFIELYAVPTLDAVLRHQVWDQSSLLDGGIYQNSVAEVGGDFKFVRKLFPFYVARCIPALLEGYRHTGRQEFLDGAVRAAEFILRHRYEDGSFPQVVYENGAVASYPRWVAGAGDILRTLDLLVPYGLDFSAANTQDWLLNGQDSNGAFRTARGFGSLPSQQEPLRVPHFLDILHVCGWNDKAFRYLSGLVPAGSRLSAPDPMEKTEIECSFDGQPCVFYEDSSEMVLRAGEGILYQWRKGTTWADVSHPSMLLK